MKLILSILAVAAALAAEGPEQAIRQADAAWLKAVESKSVEQAVAAYDAEVLTAGSAMPPARGLAGIRAMWTQLFAEPGFSLTWKADKVSIMDSGTMAVATGTWRGGPEGGPFLAVWKKQPGGAWKVLIDSAWR